MKRVYLYTKLVLSCCVAFAPIAAAGDAETGAASPTGDQALTALLQGNGRFVTAEPAHPNQSPERVKEVATGQHPLAVVLTCADSRVAPEIVFDQGVGDLFVLRNAGNVLDDHTIGSIEYAVEHLHVPLVLVMGHSGCGAATAVLAGGHAPGHIHSIVEALQPALEVSAAKPGDKLDNLVRANVERVSNQLQRIEPILGRAVAAGQLKVVGARYDLTSGKVEIIK